MHARTSLIVLGAAAAMAIASPASARPIDTVNAGFGLNGGGTGKANKGTVTVAVDPSVIQRRIGDLCPAGSSIRAIAQNGTVTCETDNVGPSFTAGTGLALNGTEFSLSFDPTTQSEFNAFTTLLASVGGGPLVDWSNLGNVPAGFADGTDNVGLTSIGAGAGISVTDFGSTKIVTNTGDSDPSDDITSLTAGAGISISGSGNSRTIASTPSGLTSVTMVSDSVDWPRLDFSPLFKVSCPAGKFVLTSGFNDNFQGGSSLTVSQPTDIVGGLPRSWTTRVRTEVGGGGGTATLTVWLLCANVP